MVRKQLDHGSLDGVIDGISAMQTWVHVRYQVRAAAVPPCALALRSLGAMLTLHINGEACVHEVHPGYKGCVRIYINDELRLRSLR
jgi:hypothetical protein